MDSFNGIAKPSLIWEAPSNYFRRKNLLNLCFFWGVVILFITCLMAFLIIQLGEKLSDYPGIEILIVLILAGCILSLFANAIFPYSKRVYEINSHFFAVTKGDVRIQYNLTDIESYRYENVGGRQVTVGNNVLVRVIVTSLMRFLLKKSAIKSSGVKWNFILRLKGENKKDILLVTTNKENSRIVLEALKVYLPVIFYNKDPLWLNP